MDSNSGGCMGVFEAIICAAGLLLFGSCTVVPAISEWQDGNAQVATINANRDAQIAQLQADRDLQVAKAAAQRDIQIAQQQAQAAVQLAAIDLAAQSARSGWQTLQIVIMAVFGVACLMLSFVGLIVWKREGGVA